MIPLKDTSTDLDVCITNNLKFQQHVCNVVQKAERVTTSISRSTVNLDASTVIFILTTCVRPLLENASFVWNMGCMGNVRQLETAQEDGQKKLMG